MEDDDTSRLPVLERLDDLAGFVDRAAEEVFLRYSRGPEQDCDAPCSRDYEAAADLPGLSVTPITPEPWWRRPTREWVARRICKYAEVGQVEGRIGWVLSGRVVGRGPDHEPLVVELRAHARISDALIAEARRCYRERFAVGDDSTDLEE